MSIDPLDRKIGLILKDGVPGFFLFLVRRDLNGFIPITSLQIWFDSFSSEAGFLCIGREVRREDVFVRVHREESETEASKARGLCEAAPL